MVSFTIANLADRPQAIELCHELYQYHIAPGRRLTYSLQDFTTLATDPHTETRFQAALAPGDDSPLGFLLAYRLTCFVYLDLLFVHPSHRRQGVGRALLDRMSEELSGLPLELCCDVTDGELSGWLGRYGFRHITPEPSVAYWMYKPTRGG